MEQGDQALTVHSLHAGREQGILVAGLRSSVPPPQSGCKQVTFLVQKEEVSSANVVTLFLAITFL